VSIASSVARSVATPVARAVAGLGGGGSVWTPASLATLRQWLSDNYYSAPVGGLQVIESLEFHGTVRAPQPGCCALFDGTNDVGSVSIAKPVTVSLWVKRNSPLVSFSRCYGIGNEHTLFFDVSGNVNFYHNNALIGTYSGFSPSVNTHFLATLEAGVAKLYVNGELEVSGASSALSGTATIYIGADSPGVQHWPGKIWDVRTYSVPKSAAEAAAIFACDYTNLDTTGILAGWYLNDRAGTTARDWSGNGHDLTLTGPITEATFWAEDSSITANRIRSMSLDIDNARLSKVRRPSTRRPVSAVNTHLDMNSTATSHPV